MVTGAADDIDSVKAALRAEVLTARRTLRPDELTAAAEALRDRALETLAPAPTVALYASTGTNPSGVRTACTSASCPRTGTVSTISSGYSTTAISAAGCAWRSARS